MEETQYSFYQRFINSIRPGSFYTEIRTETLGRALGYFLMVACLLTAVVFIKSAFMMNAGLQEAAFFIQKEVPDFRLENGMLTVYDAMPIIRELDGVMCVVDTSGQYTEDILSEYPSGLFISADKLVYKKNAFESRTMKFSELQEATFTKADALALTDQWAGPIIAVLAVVGFLFAIGGKFIGLMAVSLLGLLMNAVVKARLSYGEVLRTSAYVMTVPLLMKTVVALSGFPIPFFFIAYYGVAAAYFYGAFKQPAEDVL